MILVNHLKICSEVCWEVYNMNNEIKILEKAKFLLEDWHSLRSTGITTQERIDNNLKDLNELIKIKKYNLSKDTENMFGGMLSAISSSQTNIEQEIIKETIELLGYHWEHLEYMLTFSDNTYLINKTNQLKATITDLQDLINK